MPDRSTTLGLVGLGASLALGMVLSAWVASSALLAVKREGQALEVKGFAERPIESDYATWTGSFTTRAATIAQAYAALEAQRDAVTVFLDEQGVPGPLVEWRPVAMQVLYRQNEKGVWTNEIEGYALTQSVKVASPEIELVGRLSREAASLVKAGIEFSSNAPEYLYTGLGDLKIEMLAEATADARRRAETLAEQSGGRIGPLLSARQGVFQITPAHSTEVSDYGRNDTTSRDKSIKAVVTMRFAVERP